MGGNSRSGAADPTDKLTANVVTAAPIARRWLRASECGGCGGCGERGGCGAQDTRIPILCERLARGGMLASPHRADVRGGFEACIGSAGWRFGARV